MSLHAGTHLGRYQILGFLGAGGMGEVYRARDTQLHREVALKIVLEAVSGDTAAEARFQREARAIASVNHPNICAVHDVGVDAGRRFLVMELLEGETLQQRLSRGPFEIPDLLEHGIALADALHAAHAREIIHRDLKPANVLFTSRGQLKILDFGLARAIDPLNTSTRAGEDVITGQGTAVGTAAYMSPEQLRGEWLDGRTDVFSLGLVLYEMATAQRAFSGSTGAAVAAAILNDEVRPPGDVRADVPAQIDTVILKALEKDRDLRYQSAADLRADLKRIKKHISAERQTASAEVSSPSTPIRLVNAGKRKRWIAAIAAASGLAVVSYLVLSRGSRTETIRTAAAVAVPLTAYQGFEFDPSLSPDGSQVAFSWNGPTEDNYDIYVKLAGPGGAVRLTTNPARDDSPAWSPDGRLIAFQRFVSEVSRDVFVVPALGGAERQVATLNVAGLGMSSSFGGAEGAQSYGLTRNLSWTPDGRWIAFGGGPSEQESRGIWLTAVDRSERRRLTTVGGHDFGDTSPAFSQDGRVLAFVRQHTISASEVYVLPLSSALMPVGAPARVTPESGIVRGVAWVPGGNGLVFSVQGHLGLSRLHRIALAETRPEPVGPPELLPFGEQATAISVSRTGRLVYAAQFRDASIWKIPLTGREDRPGATPIVPSTFDEQTPDYSPDGTRLAFASTRSGVEEIWVANADGSNPVQVTSMGGPLCSNPRWSPDGRTILLNAHREGSSDLYLLRPDSGDLRRITDDPAEEIEPRWSRDGRTIYFGSNRTGRFEVWKMPAAGGASVRITQGGGMTPTESPDGRFLYYAKHDAQPTAIWRVPVSGGEERSVVDGVSYSLNFVVAKRGLYFVAVGDAPHQTSIDFFDYTTGKRTTLLALGKQYWWGMALSPDQRSLLYSVIDTAGSNLMLVDNFQ